MEILVSPPFEAIPAALDAPAPEDSMSDTRLNRLSVIVTALSALYQVQARLWAIPDKAEVLPGVSLSVTRRPYRAVSVKLPVGADAPVVASAVCAARALGIRHIHVDCGDCPSPDVCHILESLGVDAIPESDAALIDWSSPMPFGAAVVADESARLADVARIADSILGAGYSLHLITSSPQLAAALPAVLTADARALCVVLYPGASSLIEPLEALRPSMIVAEVAEARSLPEKLTFASNILAGPVPENPQADALATLITPIYPIHELTVSHALIDPITIQPRS